MFEDYKNKDQLDKIRLVLIIIRKDGKLLDDVDEEYLKQYLKEEDIKAYFDILDIYNKKKKEGNNQYKQSVFKSNISRDEVKLEWDTPYTILGIEEKEYTKEELLDVVGKKINFIKDHEIDKAKINDKIYKVLDAYNEIIKTSSKKR